MALAQRIGSHGEEERRTSASKSAAPLTMGNAALQQSGGRVLSGQRPG